jgi:serine/threonine-protein kinase
VGQPAEQAKAELWNALFASAVVTVPSNEPEGTVVSTDPPAGTRADWRAITVTVNASAGPPNVSAGPPPEPTQASPPDRQPGNAGPGGGGPPGVGGGENQKNNNEAGKNRGKGED